VADNTSDEFNDRGQILAYGWNSETDYYGRPVLLDPAVPEPAPSILVASGLILLATLTRRKSRNRFGQ